LLPEKKYLAEERRKKHLVYKFTPQDYEKVEKY
jgi:hypothetical protein